MLKIHEKINLKPIPRRKPKETIITRKTKKTKVNLDGEIKIYYEEQKINISKMINEKKKILKKDKAQETLKTIEKVLLTEKEV